MSERNTTSSETCSATTSEVEVVETLPEITSPAERSRRQTAPREKRKLTLFERAEAFVSRLSTRNNFWHRVCSMLWLPYAFRSGIKMLKNEDDDQYGTFTAVLPFRHFNKNWYNAMAGASLLANSEVAGGMYVFKKAGSDYRVVCKELTYRFLRPCIGPAVYRCEMMEDLDALIEAGGEFNIKVKLNIYQGLTPADEREKRVGRCFATFHVSPKEQHKEKAAQGRDPKQLDAKRFGEGVNREDHSDNG
ncbi:MAG: hypothetical protein AAGB34_08045 [Planctomycetota bacterium]